MEFRWIRAYFAAIHRKCWLLLVEYLRFRASAARSFGSNNLAHCPFDAISSPKVSCGCWHYFTSSAWCAQSEYRLPTEHCNRRLRGSRALKPTPVSVRFVRARSIVLPVRFGFSAVVSLQLLFWYFGLKERALRTCTAIAEEAKSALRAVCVCARALCRRDTIQYWPQYKAHEHETAAQPELGLPICTHRKRNEAMPHNTTM